MRKNNEQVKQELLKRKEAYLINRSQLKKRIIASLLCLALLVGVFAAVLLAPEDKPVPSTDDSSFQGIYVGENSVAHTSNDNSFESEPDDGEDSYPENSSDIPTDSSDEPVAPPEESEVPSDEPVAPPEESEVPSDEPVAPPEESEVSSDEPVTHPDEPDNTDIKMLYPVVLESGESLNLIKTLSRQEVIYAGIDHEFAKAETDFAAELFKGCALGEENALISPLSVMIALAMTSNGAAGKTKAGMEKALGGLTVDKLNSYLSQYISQLPNDEYASLQVANAIWVNEGYGINEYFLQDCLDYYGADAYMARFSDTTRTEINQWISDNTNGQIEEMLKEIDPDMLLYIINTLDFEARWQSVYEKNEIWQSSFTNSDGSTSTVEFMHCTAGMDYIETEEATGFIKKYCSGYSFVALLPTDENGLDALVSSINGEKIRNMLENQCSERYIDTSIPKFNIECNISSDAMKQALSNMGMEDAFETSADFRKIFNTAYIDEVLHSTSITVDELGTKAGAVTVVGGGPGCPPLYATVDLDRPFVYMIIDDELNIPIFMGTVTNLG